VFFGVFFSWAGGKAEYRSSPGSLICRHPVFMMTDKTGSNPDRVIASLKKTPICIFKGLCRKILSPLRLAKGSFKHPKGYSFNL
jgi:hypothetical protein